MNEKIRVIWTDDAIEDLEYLESFYNQFNPHFAKEAVKTILESSKLLEIYPKIAPIELELQNLHFEFRSLVVMRRFKIVYYFEENNMIIFCVADCRQNLTTKIEKRLSH